MLGGAGRGAAFDVRDDDEVGARRMICNGAPALIGAEEGPDAGGTSLPAPGRGSSRTAGGDGGANISWIGVGFLQERMSM